jgi:protein-S-isoprenylcysteine O-methyltransferase Ste14
MSPDCGIGSDFCGTSPGTCRTDGLSVGLVGTKPTSSLESRLLRSNVREFGVQAVVLFAAAGTFRYWQAWTVLALRIVPYVLANVYMIRHDRELLRRRLAVEEEGEKETVHRVFFALLIVVGVALLVVAGLDRRFGWSEVPLPVELGACAVSTAGLFLIYRVFRENTYCSSVVELREHQTVISTGPYRLVRHPMYTGGLLGAAALPLALGSYVAAVFVLPVVVLHVVRILAEETFLAARLPGYADYMKTTRKRLVPGVW